MPDPPERGWAFFLLTAHQNTPRKDTLKKQPTANGTTIS
ncbi:hypothetical protein M23134_08310 [Microscilla marina ATCC 23134]|uniref:Uncharacterized protein n=1 Tax=Microscilla marina ATCC 23134 TaxID=313606 RepID=A1ZQI6_MICM2|nr:hypothetical protein M23134_08310 [Microscilla marina ATCC 23134]